MKRGGCPRVRLCRASCLHRQMVEDYQLKREQLDAQCEAAAHGYAAETTEWRRDNGMTFAQWLTSGGWDPYRRQEPA